MTSTPNPTPTASGRFFIAMNLTRERINELGNSRVQQIMNAEALTVLAKALAPQPERNGPPNESR